MDQGEAVYANTTIGRDPRHVIEDVVEENADEFNPHASYYDGGEDFPLKTDTNCAPGDQTALVLAPPTRYHTMAVIPGRCLRGCLDIFSFIICLALIIIQLGLIDYYYLTVLSDRIWYSWIGADALVIVVMLWLLVLALKYNQTQMEEVCSVDGKVKFAWIGWLVYSLVLVGKVATCFRLFYSELPPGPLDNNDKLFDDHLFKLGLSLSVLIFLFLLEAHHYTPLMSARQLYITYLATAICLDLVDNIYFLDLLWQSLKDGWNLPMWLDITILTVACVNFVMPTFALLKLRFGRFPRLLYISDKVWSLLYVLIVNGPFLGLRIYLYILLEVQQRGRHYDPSLFAVKNIAMIYLAMRELWTRLQYWRMKRRATGSRGELTGHHNNDDDH
ncbi:hypothetical protein V3C99_009935 [Haemonchus contortus]|uniref:Transmembrane protein n=1 Tax=Haemonchus contortus TaxID=6289 RepID=A0A7I4YI79_HAECO|nr:Protein F13E9.11, isoform b [Haemonchus contortus]